MTTGSVHYDMGGELPPSPRQRQRQALAVHMIDPFDIAVLCGTPVFQNATNDPQRVTCRACLRVRRRRLMRAGVTA